MLPRPASVWPGGFFSATLNITIRWLLAVTRHQPPAAVQPLGAALDTGDDSNTPKGEAAR